MLLPLQRVDLLENKRLPAMPVNQDAGGPLPELHAVHERLADIDSPSGTCAIMRRASDVPWGVLRHPACRIADAVPLGWRCYRAAFQKRAPCARSLHRGCFHPRESCSSLPAPRNRLEWTISPFGKYPPLRHSVGFPGKLFPTSDKSPGVWGMIAEYGGRAPTPHPPDETQS